MSCQQPRRSGLGRRRRFVSETGQTVPWLGLPSPHKCHGGNLFRSEATVSMIRQTWFWSTKIGVFPLFWNASRKSYISNSDKRSLAFHGCLVVFVVVRCCPLWQGPFLLRQTVDLKLSSCPDLESRGCRPRTHFQKEDSKQVHHTQ